MSSLDYTLDDIWWGDSNIEDITGLVSKALSDFSAAYSQWTQEVVDINSGGVRMDIHSDDLLKAEFKNYCNGRTLEEVAQNTSFNMNELRTLKSGGILADGERTKELSEEVFKAHNSKRLKAVETLCNELRTGLNPAEATRVNALLNKSITDNDDVDNVVAYMDSFRKQLNLGE